MILTRSETESKAYGLELFRTQLEEFSEVSELISAIHSQHVDVLRLKVNANNKDVYSFLNSLGIPYQLYNLLYSNSVEIDELEDGLFHLPEGYTTERCSRLNQDRLVELVANSIDRKTWVNYESELVKHLITNNRELEAASEFAAQHSSNKSGRSGWIIQYNGEDVGFVTGTAVGQNFIGTLCGIVPKHRGLDHSKTIYTISYQHCREKGFSTFQNHIGVMNIPSQRSATGQNMVATDVYFHFELYPLLSLNEEASHRFDYSGSFKLHETLTEFWKIEIGARKLCSTSTSWLCEDLSGNYSLAKIAVNNDSCLLIVANVFNSEHDLLLTHYMKFK